MCHLQNNRRTKASCKTENINMCITFKFLKKISTSYGKQLNKIIKFVLREKWIISIMNSYKKIILLYPKLSR